MQQDLLVSDRIGRLNRGLLAFRIGLYTVIVAGLAASPLPSAIAIAIVVVATFVPALPLPFVRPIRIEVAIAVSLTVEFVGWYWYGQVAGLTVLPLLSIAVAGLFSTRKTSMWVGAIGIGLHVIQIISHVVDFDLHDALPNPPSMVDLVGEMVLIVVVSVAFVSLGSMLRGFQSDLAVQVAEQARLDGLIAEKDHMISSLAHELRTPLTGVIGFSDLLGQEAQSMDPEDTAMISRSIASEGHRLANIINNFVVAARATNDGVTVDTRDVDIRPLIESIWDRMSIDLGWDIEITGTAVAIADPSRLSHILENLLDNALRHGASPVMIDITSTATGALTTISDGGGGPESGAEHIFERYNGDQSLEKPGNIGLGLPTARLLAERMDGQLELVGRAFRLRLPAAVSTEVDSDEPSFARSPTV